MHCCEALHTAPAGDVLRRLSCSHLPCLMHNRVPKLVAIGEAAVAGVGIGMALIGAVEIASVISMHPWVAAAKHYDDCIPLLGGMAGALARWISILRPQGGKTGIAHH